MAPLPTENTARLLLDYVSNSGTSAQSHTALVRFGAPDVTIAEAQQTAAAMLGAIGEANFGLGWRVVQTRYGALNDVNTFPVAMDSALAEFEGSASLGGWTIPDETVEHRFVGRGAPSGRRVFLSLYGLVVPRPATFRTAAVTGESSNWVGDALGVLNAAGNAGEVFINIAGDSTFWYGYANWQQNSYWEGELRS